MNKPPSADPAAENDLENRLRELYRSQDPPVDLSARILQRARELPVARNSVNSWTWLSVFVLPAWWRRFAVLSLSSALLFTSALIVLDVVHRRHLEDLHARQAQTRLLDALQVTNNELNWAESQIRRDISRSGGRPPAVNPKGMNAL